jgi:adenylate cyclase
MQGSEAEYDAVAVRAQLQRILSSPEFDATERNGRFLAYVVEEALSGRSDRIKGYSVATSVFGRAEDFDPQLDPIVRIEAGRLRRSLERYYFTAGKDDPLRITIPKGSYAPSFEQVQCAPKPKARNGPSIFVKLLEEDGDHSVCSHFSRGFTRQVIVGLTRFTDLFVFGPETTFDYGNDLDPIRLRDDLDVDFVLMGGATLSEDRFSVEVFLIDARTGQNVWADNFAGELAPIGIFSVRDELASRVATTLAQPFGVIFNNRARQTDSAPPHELTSYECILEFYKYFKYFNENLHEQARQNLENAIVVDPTYADSFACLSRIYTDAYRFGFNREAMNVDPCERAMKLARRAIELAPNSSAGFHALGLILWFGGDIDASFNAFEEGRRLNPNDTEILSDLGFRYALRADWRKAVPLLEESFERNPGQPRHYRLGISLYHYMGERYDEALCEARQLDAPNLVYGQLMFACAAAKLGHAREAAAALDKILKIDPAYGDHVVADLEKRYLDQNLIRALVDGLRSAGLSGRDMSRIDLRHLVSGAA